VINNYDDANGKSTSPVKDKDDAPIPLTESALPNFFR
jgi:hypothetical protein